MQVQVRRDERERAEDNVPSRNTVISTTRAHGWRQT